MIRDRDNLESTYTIESLILSILDDVVKLIVIDASLSTRLSVDLTCVIEECNDNQIYGDGDGCCGSSSSNTSTEAVLALNITAMVEVSKLLRVSILKVYTKLGDELEGLLID